MYSVRFLMKASPVPPSLVFCFSDGTTDTRTWTMMEENTMAPNPSWKTLPGVCKRSPKGSFIAPSGPASSTPCKNLRSRPGKGSKKQMRDRRTANTVIKDRLARSWSSSHLYARSRGPKSLCRDRKAETEGRGRRRPARRRGVGFVVGFLGLATGASERARARASARAAAYRRGGAPRGGALAGLTAPALESAAAIESARLLPLLLQSLIQGSTFFLGGDRGPRNQIILDDRSLELVWGEKT